MKVFFFSFAILLIMTISGFCQNVNIYVHDAQNVPISGAQVTVDGTGKRTNSDGEKNFYSQKPAGSSLIVSIRKRGYQAKNSINIRIPNNRRISFLLLKDTPRITKYLKEFSPLDIPIDINGDIKITNSPSHGKVRIDAGRIVYIPPSILFGRDRLIYEVSVSNRVITKQEVVIIDRRPAKIIKAMITLFTIGDNKDKGDSVTIRLLQNNGQVVFESGPLGEPMNWPRNYVLPPIVFSPDPFDLSEILKLNIYKTGRRGWQFSVEISGIRADNKRVILFKRTDPVKLGDGNNTSKEWLFKGNRILNSL